MPFLHFNSQQLGLRPSTHVARAAVARFVGNGAIFSRKSCAADRIA
jgi:hypothetical protein